MVAYIRSDLDFILAQIKIAEAHAAGQPLYGPNGLIPSYNLAWGLRTVDGTYNNLLHPEWGASDNPFPEPLGTQYKTIMVPAGPGGALVPVSYQPGVDNDGPGTASPGDVFDPYVRTISNLIADQTLGNPSAILTGLQRAGIIDPANHLTVTSQISDLYQPLKPLFNAVNEAARANASAQAAASASPGNVALQNAAAVTAANLATAEAALAAEDDELMALLATTGIELEGANIVITNAAPDEGLSAPFNSWFTLFGQFFDHGLDLVAKGGNGTVFVPLMPDDPLYVPGSNTNFMVLTRATLAGPGADGILVDDPSTAVNEAADNTNRPVNTTTSYVDQNQTYSSHPSHQVFLRQYVLNAAGDPVPTGNLMEGANGGMATWGELKAQAADLLGIQLLDSNVGNIPLLATDQYGNFIPGANGFPQIVTATGLVEGNPAANGGLGVLVPANALFTGHAFLADIAHNAVPEGLADGDIEIGLENPGNQPGVYDNELLDAHYVAGDGRANENIGLTAVHHVFHAEHNRLVEHTKEVVLADAQAMLDNGASQAEAVAFLNEWLVDNVATVPETATGLVWDGERLFQAAKFGTEMQYQHLVFEEFARKIQPNINVFLVPDGYDVTIDPSIVAEFAHVVYRFGHSMLTETIDRFDPTFTADQIGLIEGFLNPIQFANNGGPTEVLDGISAGAIVRGMTRQVGNEIDEFVTGALRNNLLGLPLDLATINLARGRDTGVPSLNAARAQFYEATNQDALLKPYESWADFAAHLKHEASIINFIAAYGTHASITGAQTIEAKRDAAFALVLGGTGAPADRLDFLNATGQYAGGSLGGLNNVDLWIGGLAEEIMPFGGMLGSTFNFVFEIQMEKLQNSDRFYYLQRLDGLHLFGEMENNSFAAMIMRNTNATHLPSDVFSTPGLILEVDQSKQFNDLDGDGDLETGDPTGGGLLTQVVIRDNPTTPGVDTNYLRYNGDQHVVLGGTNANDVLIASDGDDTLYGDGGNDRLEGDFGNDIINGGDGDDIIVDSGGDDNIKAGSGNDVVHAGPGLDLVMGGKGQDFIFLGTDMGSEVFAGEGDDFIYGNRNAERILGNEGSDWIETGTFDGAPGDNFDEIFAHDGIDGHDVFLGDGGFDEFIGEGGDDIMVGSAGRGKMAGMSGFDWATYKDNTFGVNADLSIPIVFDENPTLPQNAALDEYASMEGLSGTRFNDTLSGSDAVAADRVPAAQGGTEGYAGSALDEAGIALIKNLQELLGQGVTSYSAGDIILGGDGSDRITGRGGDDIIDGDKWLDVQIGVFAANDPNHTGTPLELHNSMTTLASRMFNGTINPGQLAIVRTIRNSADQPDSDGIADVDVAVFSGARAEYDIDFNADGTVTVSHVGGLATDGTDTIRNVEILDFTDQDISLVAPTLDLHGDTIVATPTQFTQAYRDEFGTVAYNNSNGTGVTNWTASWAETGDDNLPGTGDFLINSGRLQLSQTVDDNDSITRAINGLPADVTAATLSFNYQSVGLDDGFLGIGRERVIVEARNTATGNWTVLGDLGGTTTAVFSAPISPALLGANTQIRLRVDGGFETGETFFIDNVNIAVTRSLTTTVPGAAGNNYETTYTENGAGVAIAAGPVITDDGANLASARVVLTNASAGDVLSVAGALPSGITWSVDVSVAGQIILNLTGTSSLANYRTAIQQVRYSNTSDNPDTADRILQVSVNDGLLNSNVATTTVNIVPTNDAPIGNPDNVITNVASGVNFSIARSALLANDLDPEGSGVSITAVGGQNGLNAPVLGPTAVTVSDTGPAGGSFNYVASDGALTDPTTSVSVTRVTGTTITGTGASEIIVGDLGATTINGGGGNDHIDGGDGNDQISAGVGDDIVQAGTGNDTIIWNANDSVPTDGFDVVDGGTSAADTFVLNGQGGTTETFRIYAKDAAIAAGVTVSGANTEIVITRTVGLTTTVIAELDNIEEIRVNTQQVTSPGGTPPGGGTTNSGDTIQVIGNFNAPFTSLNFNTITIDGDSGNDTVDISSLQSAHRIVFRSNGGNDTIIGTLRAQDIIELAPGLTVNDYNKTVNDNGTVTLKSAIHSVTYMSDEEPVIKECEEDEDENENEVDNKDPVVTGERFMVKKGEVLSLTVAQLLANDIDLDGGTLSLAEINEDEHGKAVLNPDGTITFTPKSGFTGEAYFTYTVSDSQGGTTEGKVSITVAKPEPMAVNGGRGNDQLAGDEASDRIKGGNGHDRLDGGAGADRMWGGRGNDTYTVDDRSDQVHESRDGGNDTVKASVSYSLAGTHVEKLVLTGSANLNGTGNSLNNSLMGNSGDNVLKGMAGNDKIEGGRGDDHLYGGKGDDRLNGGAGDDRLDGGSGNNRMTGGSGDDVFVFNKQDGMDTVTDFRASHDKVDVSGLSGVDNMSDLYMWQSGSSTVIWHHSAVLVLNGVKESDLDSSDFIF